MRYVRRVAANKCMVKTDKCGAEKSSDMLDVMIAMVLFDYMKQRIMLFTELERATDLAE